MKRLALIVFSLAANLLLTATILWYPQPAASTARPLAPKRVLRPPQAGQACPEVLTTKRVRFFHWSEVWSTDFFRYRDNLHGIGCPDRTVRDILESEVTRAYVARLEVLLRPVAGRFWDTLAELVHDEDQAEETYGELGNKIDELEDEYKKVLGELLGENRGRPSPPGNGLDATEQGTVDFLSVERQGRLAALQGEFAEEFQILLQQAQREGRGLSKEDQQAFAARKRAALESLMTPEEWFEYRLRTSPHVGLRNLGAANLSEEELRTIAGIRMQSELGRESSQASSDAPLVPVAGAEDEIRSYLGPARYEQLQLAGQPHYQQLFRLGQRTGLPEPTLVAANDIWRVAQEEAARLKSRQDLPPEQRSAIFEAFRAETSETLRRTLPADQFENYTHVFGSWWDQLGR